MSATAPNYNHTVTACFVGYITQAVINNFMPLLFVTFAATLGIDMARLSALITVNFVTQLVVDVLAGKFVDRIGYKPCIIAAHLAALAGLLALGLLPTRVPDPYLAILAAIFLYALGGGLIEVMVSPIVEACPSEHKAKAMSLLHSFYCWGHVGVVLVSTAFFAIFGLENWRIMACLWALLPVYNFFSFHRLTPPAIAAQTGGTGAAQLLRKGLFWRLLVMMLCAGAAEQGMSQWASAFAEASLGVSKTVGDLLGPCGFATMMGLSRALYGRFGAGLDLRRYMSVSSLLCVAAYLLAALTSTPWLGLAGCMLCGLSVGVMWPGSVSLAAGSLKNGGTTMFALLALAGDLGCSTGPAAVGFAAEKAGGDLKSGLLLAVIFPAALLACALAGRKGGARNGPF